MTVIWVQTPAAQVGHISTNKSESASQQVWYLILLKNKRMQKVHVGWLQGLPHTRKKLEARSEETSVKKLSADNSKVNSAFQQKLCDETDQLMTYSLFLLFCCCLFRITEQEYCFKN